MAVSLAFSSLRLRGADLHEAPVVQDEPEHVRADPPGGVARKLHATIRIVAFHRLHEPDVSLLDEVHDVSVRAPVLVGDLHDQPKVRCHEPRGEVHAARLRVLDGQAMLVFGRQ
jgi:hypothetical protein